MTQQSISSKKDQLVEDFALFSNWQERYEYIIDFKKELDKKPILTQEQIEQNEIKGCQSKVWLVYEMLGDKILFKAQSDAIIVKGLIGLILYLVNAQKPQDILDARIELFLAEQLNVLNNLSSYRANGLTAMLQKINYICNQSSVK